jgi:hypothetical protein
MNYDFEKNIAKSIKVGETVNGLFVDYVQDGVVLVDVNCKKCGQALRLFEALDYVDLCQNCT